MPVRVSRLVIETEFLTQAQATLRQLSNWRGIGNQSLRPASQVGQRQLRGRDAEVLIERREDFMDVNGPLADRIAETGRGTDDLAGANSAARQKRARHRRPVVSTGVAVDPRGTAELAPDDDSDFRKQPALIQVAGARSRCRTPADRRRPVPRHRSRGGVDQSSPTVPAARSIRLETTVGLLFRLRFAHLTLGG
jgi:hypothetical protein